MSGRPSDVEGRRPGPRPRVQLPGARDGRVGATPVQAVAALHGRGETKRETWLPATPASARTARHIVSDAALEAGLEGESVWDLMLATSEAVANAVQHGKPWPNDCVLLATERCPRGLSVEVCNLGTFDSTLEPAPVEATSGRGMQIIAALVDRFEVSNGDGRTLVRLEKRADPAFAAGNGRLGREANANGPTVPPHLSVRSGSSPTQAGRLVT
jgi:serine/threonine-protein kinase RsbW